jgi:general secretion pathway protein I
MMQRGGERGSTLIEVLVAFAIMAGVLIVSARVFGDGIRGVERAEGQAMMAAIARREMARLEVSPALADGTFEGRDDQGFAWSVEIGRESKEVRGRQAVPFDVKVMVGRQATPGLYPVRVETVLIAVPRR